MINKESIILRAKILLYEKSLKSEDMKASQYFRSDYVYKKNSFVRFCSFMGSTILILFSYFIRIFIYEESFLLYDYKKEITNNIVILLVMIILYSIIGTIKYNKEYSIREKRINQYFNAINNLKYSSQSKDKGDLNSNV